MTACGTSGGDEPRTYTDGGDFHVAATKSRAGTSPAPTFGGLLNPRPYIQKANPKYFLAFAMNCS
jgi:hypothetical protein